MSKPERNTKESYRAYYKRVEKWERAAAGPGPIIELPAKPLNCGTCYHWGDNNQCFRYPKIVVTTGRHRCGEHKPK